MTIMTRKQAYKKLCSVIRDTNRVHAIRQKLVAGLSAFSGGVYEYSDIVAPLDELLENLQYEARILAGEYFEQAWQRNGLWTIAGLFVDEDKYKTGEWIKPASVRACMERGKDWYFVFRKAEIQFSARCEIPF